MGRILPCSGNVQPLPLTARSLRRHLDWFCFSPCGHCIRRLSPSVCSTSGQGRPSLAAKTEARKETHVMTRRSRTIRSSRNGAALALLGTALLILATGRDVLLGGHPADEWASKADGTSSIAGHD